MTRRWPRLRVRKPARPRTTRNRRVLTPEGVPLTLRVATRGARLSAMLIDMVCITLVLAGLVMLAVGLVGGMAQLERQMFRKDLLGGALQFVTVLWLIAVFVLRNGWFLAFELGPRGATPGKRLIGIRVAARDGGRLTAEMILARNLMREMELTGPMVLVAASASAEGAMAWLYGGVALGWALLLAGLPLWNADRLRPGDLVGGTWVVEAAQTPLRRPPPALATAEPEVRHDTHTYVFSPADLSIYGEYELTRLEEVLRARQDETMAQVATAICARLGWTAPEGQEIERFLTAYYQQLRARLEQGLRLGRRKADKHSGDNAPG